VVYKVNDEREHGQEKIFVGEDGGGEYMGRRGKWKERTVV